MGIVIHAVLQTDSGKLFLCDFFRIVLIHFFHYNQCFHHVFQGSTMAKQIESLEYHGCVSPDIQNILFTDLARHIKRYIIQRQNAFLCLLQKIQGSQEGRFTGPAGSNYGNYVTGLHPVINPFNNLVAAKTFLPVFNLNHPFFPFSPCSSLSFPAT